MRTANKVIQQLVCDRTKAKTQASSFFSMSHYFSEFRIQEIDLYQGSALFSGGLGWFIVQVALPYCLSFTLFFPPILSHLSVKVRANYSQPWEKENGLQRQKTQFKSLFRRFLRLWFEQVIAIGWMNPNEAMDLWLRSHAHGNWCYYLLSAVGPGTLGLS